MVTGISWCPIISVTEQKRWGKLNTKTLNTAIDHEILIRMRSYEPKEATRFIESSPQVQYKASRF